MTERDEYMEARNRALALVRVNRNHLLKQVTELFDSVSRDVYALVDDSSLTPLTEAHKRGAQDGIALGIDELANELTSAARWEKDWEKDWDFEIMETDDVADGLDAWPNIMEDQSTNDAEPTAE